MKRLIWVLMFLFCLAFLQGQEKYSYIYFYRIKSFAEPKESFNILINDQKVAEIKKESRIKLKLYSVGEMKFSFYGDGCQSSPIFIEIKNGEDYYVQINGVTCFLRNIDLPKGKADFNKPYNFTKKIEVIEEDINKPFGNLIADNISEAEGLSEANSKIESRAGIETRSESDVDINIPVTGRKNTGTFALIIGNEDYKNEIKVKYAKNDASTFREYLIKTIGVPPEQIHYVENASYGTMLSEIVWIKSVARAYREDAKLIFYYAGHGMPDNESKSAYLLPADGIASQTRTAIKVDELYDELNEFPTKQVTVFLDACFSGAARDGMLASGRGVIIKPKANIIKGNLVVFTAVSGDQTAHPYEEKSHGLFSYFLFKKIQESNGSVTYKELGDYISKEVSRRSVIKGKEQTPKVNVSQKINEDWGNWSF
jgi:hypothetical protein